MAASQQIFPNEVLHTIIYNAIEHVSLSRGTSLRLVNRFFADEVDDFYFFHGRLHQEYESQDAYRCAVQRACICRFRISFAARGCEHIGSRGSDFTARQLERYWKGFLIRSLDTVPQCLHQLRQAVHNGLEWYIRGSTSLLDNDTGKRDDGPYSMDKVTVTASYTTLVNDACRAMVLLLGHNLAFSTLESLPNLQPQRPQQLMRTILIESAPVLIACVLATVRREQHLMKGFLDTLKPATESVWEYRVRYARHSAHPMIYVPKLCISEAETPVAQALAACLTIAIAMSDLPLFKFLHDYDLQETADGRFQHRFIGSQPFRDFKFHNFRHVQETALSCGEAEMFHILVSECGWHWPWSVSRFTTERFVQEFGASEQRSEDDRKMDVPGELLEARWWCCRRLSENI